MEREKELLRKKRARRPRQSKAKASASTCASGTSEPPTPKASRLIDDFEVYPTPVRNSCGLLRKLAVNKVNMQLHILYIYIPVVDIEVHI